MSTRPGFRAQPVSTRGNRATAAQAQATIALAEQQKRAAAAAELGNMIAARHMGIFRSADEYAAVESKIRGLLGLDA